MFDFVQIKRSFQDNPGEEYQVPGRACSLKVWLYVSDAL